MLLDVTLQFLEKESPRHVVRAAEPSGFSHELLRETIQLGLTDLAATEDLGSLGLIANAFGQYCAPIPVVEQMIAARILARAEPEEADLLSAMRSGDKLVLSGPGPNGRHLVPYGTYADAFVLQGAPPVVAEAGAAIPRTAGLGLPGLVEIDPASGRQLTLRREAVVRSPDPAHEWRSLTACWLVGVGQAALADATCYAKERKQFGVPIGSFQAIAHLLADVHVELTAAHYLALEAAWAACHEPERFPALSLMAYVTASKAAQRSATAAVHVHGGYGFVLDSDVQVFYRRAKAWGVLLGSPDDEYVRLAEELRIGVPS